METLKPFPDLLEPRQAVNALHPRRLSAKRKFPVPAADRKAAGGYENRAFSNDARVQQGLETYRMAETNL